MRDIVPSTALYLRYAVSACSGHLALVLYLLHRHCVIYFWRAAGPMYYGNAVSGASRHLAPALLLGPVSVYKVQVYTIVVLHGALVVFWRAAGPVHCCYDGAGIYRRRALWCTVRTRAGHRPHALWLRRCYRRRALWCTDCTRAGCGPRALWLRWCRYILSSCSVVH